MRAPFDRLIDLYFGPGTATPGAPHVLAMPARVVPDEVFIDIDPPLNASLAYFTCDQDAPNGPLITPGPPGIYQFEFTHSDRVALTPGAAVTHYVQRTELRTRPGSPDYFRAYIAPLSSLWTTCQQGYADQHTVTLVTVGVVATLDRIGPTTWVSGIYTLEAEWGGVVGPGCASTWRFNDGVYDMFVGSVDGTNMNFFQPGPPNNWYVVHRV